MLPWLLITCGSVMLGLSIITLVVIYVREG